MERLTYMCGGKWRLRIGDTEYSGKAVDRLAAYEGTGLEPEEIEQLKTDVMDIKRSVDDLWEKQDFLKFLEKKECDKGIAICRSGIGMSIVANKFKGIRCAKCNDEEEARLSRAHNDSNILALGADYIETDKAIRMVRMWIATEFEGGRHQERVKLIEEIENENMK